MRKQTKPYPRRKTLYYVKNWTEYDKALVQRGSITFWLSDDFEKNWLYAGEKQRGSQFDYSDTALEIMLTIKEIFHLTNRQAEGFMRSLFVMLKIALPVPDHSTLGVANFMGKRTEIHEPGNLGSAVCRVADG